MGSTSRAYTAGKDTCRTSYMQSVKSQAFSDRLSTVHKDQYVQQRVKDIGLKKTLYSKLPCSPEADLENMVLLGQNKYL